jgi:glycosyltransferase involved in cell wall biosynthesis
MVVLGPGSCNGVDASRFAATPELMRRAATLRCQLGIPPEAPVVAFVGRLTRDKGIPELMEAFLRLDKQFPDLHLLLVGCFQNGDPVPADTRTCVETHPRVIFAGAVPDPTAYYAIADVVVLPSHREGLPMVALEAHAAGKPVVGAAATGIVNIVLDGETGLLFPVGDVPALATALAKVIADKSLARKLGAAGQDRVKREFQQERIWEALYREYLEHLQSRAAPAPLIAYSNEGESLVARSSE